jgi:hypothetical protein
LIQKVDPVPADAIAAGEVAKAKDKASGKAAIEQMKAIPVADPLYGCGVVRSDG